MFLDPSTLSEDGTVALSAVSFSKDGRYFARMPPRRRVRTGSRSASWIPKPGPDRRPHRMGEILRRPCGPPDSKGFITAPMTPPKRGVYSSQNQFQKVYYHARNAAVVRPAHLRTRRIRCVTSRPEPLRTTASGSSSSRRRYFRNDPLSENLREGVPHAARRLPTITHRSAAGGPVLLA